MTVHGAKGLEAPIVILADTMTPPAGPRPPRLLALPPTAPWSGRARKDDDAPAVAVARQAALAEAENEYRRLLYVAMTRAADLLIVCGADGERQRPTGCWYNLVREPLSRLSSPRAKATTRFSAIARPAAPRSRTARRPRPAASKTDRIDIPPWLRQPAPPTGAASAAAVALVGVRGGDRPGFRARCRLGDRAAQGAGARADRPSADAVAARYSAGRPQGRNRAIS